MRIGDEALAYAEGFSAEHGGCVVEEAITVLQRADERSAPCLETNLGADRLIAEMICPTCLISPTDDPIGLLDEWATMTPATCPTCLITRRSSGRWHRPRRVCCAR